MCARFGIVALLSVSLAACTEPRRRPTPPASADVAELWIHPGAVERRNLFYGSGGRTLAPVEGATYRITGVDSEGYSPGYDVVDATGRAWDVKLGPEAQAEVVVSRLFWAIGFHQPASYYVASWRAQGPGAPADTGPARFLLTSDFVVEGTWDWYANPFVGSRPYRGLLVLNVLVNNWDLKRENNLVHRQLAPRGGPRRRFVVQDLGATLGRTGRLARGTRNDLDGFRSEGFIVGAQDGGLQFDYEGKLADLLARVTPADVVWTCRLLARLTDRQWDDAFRAAGYDPRTRGQFIAVLHAKMAQGLALRP